MSEQKRYTAKELREAAIDLDWKNPSPFRELKEHRMYVNMLRQAADTEEENAQLKALLESVVKECENQMPERMFIRMNDEASLQVKESVTAILRAARGEGGA